jgi:hypothetical protein
MFTFRLRVILAFAGIVAVMAMSAAPSYAKIKGMPTGSTTTGTIVVTNSGEFVYESGKAAVVKCLKTEITGKWTIPAQASTTQKLTITAWGTMCTATLGTATLSVAVKSPSEFETVQKTTSATLLTATQLLTIEIKSTTNGCIITTEAANNTGLQLVEQTTNGTNEKVKVNVTGIKSKANFTCQLGGLAATSTTGELKGVEGEATNQNIT